MPVAKSVEFNFKGKKNLFLGKRVAPKFDINEINFFILLLFKELSPFILTAISGVVDKIPVKSLAKVPELPKFKVVFFFANSEPKPFPYIRYSLVFCFLI